MIFLFTFFLLASTSSLRAAETVERIEFSYVDFFKALEQEATRLLRLQYGESSGFSVEIQASQKAHNLEAVSDLVHDGIAEVLFLRDGTQPIEISGSATKESPRAYLSFKGERGRVEKLALNIPNWAFTEDESSEEHIDFFNVPDPLSWSTDPLELAVWQIETAVARLIPDLQKNGLRIDQPAPIERLSFKSMVDQTKAFTLELGPSSPRDPKPALKPFYLAKDNAEKFREAFKEAIRLANQNLDKKIAISFMSTPLIVLVDDPKNPSDVIFGFSRIVLKNSYKEVEMSFFAKANMLEGDLTRAILESLERRAKHSPRFFHFFAPVSRCFMDKLPQF